MESYFDIERIRETAEIGVPEVLLHDRVSLTNPDWFMTLDEVADACSPYLRRWNESHVKKDLKRC